MAFLLHVSGKTISLVPFPRAQAVARPLIIARVSNVCCGSTLPPRSPADMIALRNQQVAGRRLIACGRTACVSERETGGVKATSRDPDLISYRPTHVPSLTTLFTML
jgi:hypothetical protein